jgi:hypothetical protein
MDMDPVKVAKLRGRSSIFWRKRTIGVERIQNHKSEKRRFFDPLKYAFR